MITTRNRARDLERTLRVLRGLSPAADEFLVTLDGCTDDSRAVIKSHWPGARLFENATRQGSIPSRDRMLREAAGELVLSLDDDSHPIEPDFLMRAQTLFEHDPKLAILHFPQRSEEFPDSLGQADFGPDLLVASYASSGVMLRSSAYRSLPGYPAFFGHAFEEPDFALQCLAAGWRARLHTGLHIRHHYSGVNRDEIRIHNLHARNECWSAVMRCPWPWMPLVVLKRAAGQLIYACKRGLPWVIREPQWWLRAASGLPCAWKHRSPVSWSAYADWRRLLRNPRPLERP